MRSSARSTTKSNSLLACSGLPASQWSNGSLIACSTMRLRLGGGEAVLGLALEFRLADEHREHGAGAGHHVVAGDRGGALALVDALGVVLEAAQQRRAQAGFMRAAVRRRDGVAVGVEKAVGVGGPGHRPLHRAVRAGLAGAAGENIRMHQRRARRASPTDNPSARRRNGTSPVPARSSMPRSSSLAHDQRISTPPNRYAFERVILNTRSGRKCALAPKICGSGRKRTLVPRRFGALPASCNLRLRLAALERHPIELLAARDLDLHALGQRVRDRNADAVQAAGGLVDLRSRICRRRAACT